MKNSLDKVSTIEEEDSEFGKESQSSIAKGKIDFILYSPPKIQPNGMLDLMRMNN